MSNLETITKNDVFYHKGFETVHFLSWLINWLRVDVKNNESNQNLKRMAKELLENIIGEKIIEEDNLELCLDYYKRGIFGKSFFKFFLNCSTVPDIMIIINKEDKENSKYIIFNNANNIYEDIMEEKENSLKIKEKYFEVLQKYKRINDITKIKIINYSEEIFDKYLKEEYEKVGYVFDLEKMIELFSKYKNIINDSIFESYYNFLKISYKHEEKEMLIQEMHSFNNILESHINKNYKNYGVYTSRIVKDYIYTEWIKNEFYFKIITHKLKNEKTEKTVLLKWFIKNKNNLSTEKIKETQKCLSDVFTDFESIDIIDEVKNTVSLLKLKLDETLSMSQIKEKISELTDNLKKFNEIRKNEDIRNEYEEYKTSEMDYRRSRMRVKFLRR